VPGRAAEFASAFRSVVKKNAEESTKPWGNNAATEYFVRLAVGTSHWLFSRRQIRPYVHVSGITAFNAQGEIVGAGDPYAQAIQAMRNIEEALAKAGAKLTDVVRTRLFLTHITDWKEIGRAHGDIFGKVRPASTVIEVNHLVAPEMLVEIEADAFIGKE
jgi:enamine deaminase RidA (YjgF/YER057c/UK114 family)